MFFIDRDKELTADLLRKYLNKFNTEVRPSLQKWSNYYKGNHAINGKTYKDPSKECNHIITNYCKIIADTYTGYICGKPITYSSNDDIKDVQEAINYNDSAAEDTAFCLNALVHGVGYELYWLDRFAQVRYAQVNPLNAFAIYSNTLDCDLLYFVRLYEADCLEDNEEYYLELYSASSIKTYKIKGLSGTPQFIKEEPHYFGDVPVSVFAINDNEENIFNSVISLNDAYNELQSSEIDDFQAWVDAYLCFEGVDADSNDVGSMKEQRVLLLPEGAKATWLTKNANDTQIVNILENIKKNIFKVTACPDMADENFLAQSGTALAYKLVGFENVASGIVTRFKKAIQRRIEMICNVLNIKATDAVWRDININFTRNLPINITETIQLVNSLKGTVSDKTLLAQLPFISDIEEELEALEEQKQKNMALYSFGAPDEEEEEEEEE